MNMQVALLAAIGLAIVANCGVKAEEVFNPVIFAGDERLQLVAMRTHILELSEKLKAELPDNEDPETNVEAAKRMLHELGSALMGEKKVKKQALKLFVSLQDAAEKCDQESMKTLGRGYIAILDYEYTTKRTYQVFKQYLAKHAEICRPQHKQKFAEQVTKVSKDDLDKIRKSVAGLTSDQFECKNRDVSFFRPIYSAFVMGKQTFASECADGARFQLARNALQLWQSLKPEAAEAACREGRVKLPASVFDDYLFKPCKNLVNKIGDFLTLARFDAVYEDSAQKDYIDGDEAFREAMGSNVVCGSLLKEKSKLLKLLAELSPYCGGPSDD